MTTNDNNVFAFPGAAHADELGRLLIPERLTEARVAARLTQTELARRAGVTRQMISYYELGKHNPTRRQDARAPRGPRHRPHRRPDAQQDGRSHERDEARG